MSEPTTPLTVRLSAALAAGAVALLPVALLDGRYANAAASESPGVAATFLASAGVLWPLLFALSGLLAVGLVLLHPSFAPGLSRFRRWLERQSDHSRARLGATLVLGALAFVLWTAHAAASATALLASSLPPANVGGGLGATVALSGAVLGLAAVGLGAWISRSVPERVPSFGVCFLLALVVVAGFFVVAVGTGATSGAGGTLALFGVLKRAELDLRAPGLLVVFTAVCYILPAYLARVPRVALLAVALAPFLLTWRAAGAGLEERSLALALERHAPLSKLLLPRLRKLSDGDKDGFSARFGGGDCDDSSARVNPGAEDEPENGVDEDCSGTDAKRVKLEKQEPPAPKDAAEWMKQRLPKGLNVLVITVDTLRWDLGYAGYERKVSPNIDALAKRSTVFERGYALASYTSKSLPPMLIGKFPSETHRGWSHFNRFGKEDTFIAERLQAKGVRTLSVQGYWYFFQKGVGFERGFDTINTDAAPKAIQMEGDRTVNGDKLTDAAIAELGKPEYAKDPFFAWVHYVDPHAEYVKHEGHDFGSSSRDAYDSEVAFVDEHIGRLLAFLDKSKLAEKTAIIFTSDHGEAFGEHGMIRHGFEIWEELVRVPFIIHVPGVEGRRVRAARSIIDVVPTVLDLFGMPHPKGEGFDFLSGQSLLADVMGPPGHTPKERIVFVDMSAGPNNGERQAFIEGDLKLIASGGRPTGLYDLKADPGEKKDLLDDKERAGPVIDRYRAFRRELREVKVRPVPK